MRHRGAAASHHVSRLSQLTALWFALHCLDVPLSLYIFPQTPWWCSNLHLPLVRFVQVALLVHCQQIFFFGNGTGRLASPTVRVPWSKALRTRCPTGAPVGQAIESVRPRASRSSTSTIGVSVLMMLTSDCAGEALASKKKFLHTSLNEKIRIGIKV